MGKYRVKLAETIDERVEADCELDAIRKVCFQQYWDIDACVVTSFKVDKIEGDIDDYSRDNKSRTAGYV